MTVLWSCNALELDKILELEEIQERCRDPTELYNDSVELVVESVYESDAIQIFNVPEDFEEHMLSLGLDNLLQKQKKVSFSVLHIIQYRSKKTAVVIFSDYRGQLCWLGI